MSPIYLDGQPTVQTLGTNITRDAMLFTYQAVPSGVVYFLLFAPWPSEIWTPSAIAEQAGEWEDNWNQNASVQGVSSITVTQAQDDGGNLIDVAIVTVRSTSGNTYSEITVPAAEWSPSVAGTTLTTSFPDVIATERARLDAIEAGG